MKKPFFYLFGLTKEPRLVYQKAAPKKAASEAPKLKKKPKKTPKSADKGARAEIAKGNKRFKGLKPLPPLSLPGKGRPRLRRIKRPETEKEREKRLSQERVQKFLSKGRKDLLTGSAGDLKEIIKNMRKVKTKKELNKTERKTAPPVPAKADEDLLGSYFEEQDEPPKSHQPEPAPAEAEPAPEAPVEKIKLTPEQLYDKLGSPIGRVFKKGKKEEKGGYGGETRNTYIITPSIDLDLLIENGGDLNVSLKDIRKIRKTLIHNASALDAIFNEPGKKVMIWEKQPDKSRKKVPAIQMGPKLKRVMNELFKTMLIMTHKEQRRYDLIEAIDAIIEKPYDKIAIAQASGDKAKFKPGELKKVQKQILASIASHRTTGTIMTATRTRH